MTADPRPSEPGATAADAGREEPFTGFSHSSFAEGLGNLEAQGLRRRLRLIESAQGPYVTHGGRRLCCLCSNDYLGLANHPKVVAAVRSAVERWGWGAGASRLVSGHMTPHQQLEESLARFKGVESALVCSTGYQANLAAIRGLAGPQDVIFSDRLNHASIIDGARGSKAALRVFPHRDYDRLERLLKRAPAAGRRVIVTDSLFSMDGDFADLARLVELKTRYDALLCIDEAHATGVFGEHGQGLAEMMGVGREIDVVVGTLSKALGGIGGFIAASREIIEWIVNTGGAFIYTTAIPPAACAAAEAALGIVWSEEGRRRRERLLSQAGRLRRELGDRRGYDVGGSSSQIIPLMVGEAAAAVELSGRLEEEGFLIPAIRPPTVPRGQARLRISLTSEHEPEDLDQLTAVLERLVPGRFGSTTGRK